MSAPEFRFPDLNMKAGKLNSPKPEKLAPPASIRDIERDARVIQLNSKLQLYRVGLASASVGALVALVVIGAWRLLATSPAAEPAPSARSRVVQHAAVQPMSSTKRVAPVPAASMPSIVNAQALSAPFAASAPAGSVFALPIRVVAPGSAPSVSSEPQVASSTVDSGKRDMRAAVHPVQLPPPVARSPFEQSRRTQDVAANPEAHQPGVPAAQPRKKVIEHKQADTRSKHVERAALVRKVPAKVDDKKPLEQRPHDAAGKPGQVKDAHATAQEPPQAAILYVAPNRAPAAPAPQRPAAAVAPPIVSSRPAATVSVQAATTSSMDIAGVPTEGVILVESSTPDGRLVRPYRVGQTLPSGEVLVSADPSDGRIVTNRRTINLKH